MRISVSLIAILLHSVGLIKAEEPETDEFGTPPVTSEEDATLAKIKAKKDEENKFGEILKAAEGLNWGANYDPKNKFCGAYDCYSILGFDAGSDQKTLNKKELSKNYRQISRTFHPDKNGGTQAAKDRFVYIAKAYEVLTDKERKDQYDYYRVHVDEYSRKFGSTVTVTFAAETNVVGVLACILLAISALTYAYRSNKYWSVASKVIKMASLPDGGGAPEGAQLRKAVNAAIEQCAAWENHTKQAKPSNTPKPPTEPSSDTLEVYKQGLGLNPGKATSKELAKLQNAFLVESFAKKLVVTEFPDFGHGFRLAKVPDDIFLYILFVTFPVACFKFCQKSIVFYFRRLRKIPYSEEEILELTRSVVGEIKFDCYSEELKKLALKRQLWISKNYSEWVIKAAEIEQQMTKAKKRR